MSLIRRAAITLAATTVVAATAVAGATVATAATATPRATTAPAAAPAAPVKTAAATTAADYDGFIVSYDSEGLDAAQHSALGARLVARATDLGIRAEDHGFYILVHTQSYRTASALYRYDLAVTAIEENRRMHHM